MSERTPCNYHNLAWIKADAKRSNQHVTVLADATWGMGGLNVYVHPPGVKIQEMSDGEDGERKQYRVSWMQEIPERCVC